ncbi:MAG: hypothetical protein HXX14_17880 [Bacteroidetes bacterium]|nr:hypothetical protein [Bacteroidota bacterium]
MVKSQKLYFYEAGLVCSLLEIKEVVSQNVIHFLLGGLFENLIINWFIKKTLNEGERSLLVCDEINPKRSNSISNRWIKAKYLRNKIRFYLLDGSFKRDLFPGKTF